MSIGSASEIITLIHEGKGFSVASVFDLLAGASISFIGYPDAVLVHFHDMAISASLGPIRVEFVENPTVSVQGTQVIPPNRNRASPNKSRMRVFGGATTNGGTSLGETIMYGSATGVNRGADQGIIRGEWDLAADKTYAIRITNQSASTASISADMHYYEDDL